MRRTKELASQMSIDVAWNCAISLRPLERGEDDSFRMTSVSLSFALSVCAIMSLSLI
jgi:hypothetical protein